MDISIANMMEWTQEEEAANLKRLLSDIGNKAKFAKDNNVPGGASMLSQHQSGHRPIGLEAGLIYAKALGVSLAEISPRLAKMVVDVPKLTGSLHWGLTNKQPNANNANLGEGIQRLQVVDGSKKQHSDQDQPEYTAFIAAFERANIGTKAVINLLLAPEKQPPAWLNPMMALALSGIQQAAKEWIENERDTKLIQKTGS